MATAPRQSARPAQTPNQPNPAVEAVGGVAKATGNIAKATGDVARKAGEGFDLFRPFRLAHSFVGGTINGMLNGMAKVGSRGAAVGAIGGVLWAIANPAIISGVTIMGAVGTGLIFGIGGGILLGGILGAVTGGTGHAARQQAREDAVARSRLRQHAPMVSTGAHVDRVNDSNFDRQLQQNQELERNETYWQDRVSGSGMGQGRGL